MSNVHYSGFPKHLQTKSSLHISICQSKLKHKYLTLDTLYIRKSLNKLQRSGQAWGSKTCKKNNSKILIAIYLCNIYIIQLKFCQSIFKDPWCSGQDIRLLIWRSCVRIPAPIRYFSISFSKMRQDLNKSLKIKSLAYCQSRVRIITL